MRESPSIDEAWRTALIERADASRLHRGRNYVRNGRVVDLTIEPGRIIARVKGSRSRPYQVLITVPTFEGDSGDAIELVPASDRIEFMCTCPDWGDPCKHGVAVWLTVAGGLTETIEPLLALRGIRADGDVGESGNGHAPEPESGPAVAQVASLVPGRESRSADAGPTREQFWEGDLSVFEH